MKSSVANQAPLRPAFLQGRGHCLAPSCGWNVILLQNCLCIPSPCTPTSASTAVRMLQEMPPCLALESNELLNILYLPTFLHDGCQTVPIVETKNPPSWVHHISWHKPSDAHRCQVLGRCFVQQQWATCLPRETSSPLFRLRDVGACHVPVVWPKPCW